MNNNPQTALITGASSGIGLELAKIFAQNGFNLVLVARRTDKLQELAAQLPKTKVTILSKDLSLPQSAQEIYNELQKQQIQVEILVNNAGFGDFGFFHESQPSKNEQMISLNIQALTSLTQLFSKDMVSRRSGKILNVASTASFQPGPLMAVYYATKHYVLAFSEAIADELKAYNVQVSALCPGATASEFQSAASMESSKLVKDKKLPSAKEVAEYGYRSLMKGKVVAVHGLMNWLLAFSVRLMPRSWTVKIVRSISEKA